MVISVLFVNGRAGVGGRVVVCGALALPVGLAFNDDNLATMLASGWLTSHRSAGRVLRLDSGHDIRSLCQSHNGMSVDTKPGYIISSTEPGGFSCDETVHLLLARSPRLYQAWWQVRRHGDTYVIIVRTLIAIDWAKADQPFYSAIRGVGNCDSR